MKSVVKSHPVVSSLWGVGLPAWLGFAVAGWPVAVILAIVAGFVVVRTAIH